MKKGYWSTANYLTYTHKFLEKYMKNIFLIIILSISFIASTANASVSCVGKVNKILIYGKGTVRVFPSWRNNWVQICNLSEEKEGVSITTCAMWASMLQNIKENGGDAVFYYAPEDDSFDSCSTVPLNNNSPAPVYIGVYN